MTLHCSDQFVVWSGREAVDSTTKDDVPRYDRDSLLDDANDVGEASSAMESSNSSSDYGAIIPLVQVAGTATRRAVEPTWLTASNPKVCMTLYKYLFISTLHCTAQTLQIIRLC